MNHKRGWWNGSAPDPFGRRPGLRTTGWSVRAGATSRASAERIGGVTWRCHPGVAGTHVARGERDVVRVGRRAHQGHLLDSANPHGYDQNAFSGNRMNSVERRPLDAFLGRVEVFESVEATGLPAFRLAVAARLGLRAGAHPRMKLKPSLLWLVAWTTVGLVLFEGTSWAPLARAATPDSKEVRQMLDRAWAYLQQRPQGQHATQLGGQSLIGLAAYKYARRFGGREGSLPEVTQLALARALRDAQNPTALASEDNYSLGLGLVFLTEVAPYDHMAEINVFWNELLKHQKANGSWGYPAMQTGDTSQLQYAALGAWSAKMVGVDVPAESMRNLANFILRVQDPDGHWGYQGNDPGTFTRVKQYDVRPSLAAAGLGSLYVTADFLGLSAPGAPRPQSNRKLPPALRPVSDEPGARASPRPEPGWRWTWCGKP